MNGAFNFFKLIFSISLLLLSACSADKPAPMERKEQLYYGKSGVVKLIRISRAQSIKELAYSYGIDAEIIAKVNSRPVYGFIGAGEVVKIPISNEVHFEEQLFDDNEQQNYEEHIEGVTLIQKEHDDVDDNQKSDLFNDEELNRDLDNRNLKNKDDKGSLKNEVIISNQNKNILKENAFKSPTPLNLKFFIWPVNGKVISRYGKNGNLFNEGINIAAPIGTVVRAAADGEVMYVGNEPKVYGNLIIIKHNDNYLTAYAHNDKINIKKGVKVKQGQPIGTIGKTGAVSIPQLHFSVRKDKKTINPEG